MKSWMYFEKSVSRIFEDAETENKNKNHGEKNRIKHIDYKPTGCTKTRGSKSRTSATDNR